MKGRLLRLNFLRLKWAMSIALFLLFSSQLYAQTEVRVTNESNEPLMGVLAFSNDFKQSFVTDELGKFQVSAEVEIDSLQFKYLGYADTRISWTEVLRNKGLVVMINASEILDEVIFIGRTNVSSQRMAYQVEAVDQKKIQLTQSQTTVDALNHHSNVFVQKSQMGGGSPVIRGFEANKVLLVVDGVRMNNAIYRSGHLQNAVTIDQSMLDRMEVIYGPNSLLYGSDALGGVVHFRTRKPTFSYQSQNKLNTEVRYNFRYSSANQEKTSHIDFNIGGSKIASLTSVSFSDYSDLRSGAIRSETYPEFGKRNFYVETINGEDRIVENSNPNIQIGTAYSQFDLMQKFLIQTSSQSELSINTQFSTSSDVPRYDQLTEKNGNDFTFAEWYYGPQKRFLSSLNFNHFATTKFYDTARFISSFQKIDEDRIDRRFQSHVKSYQKEDVKVWSFTADFSKQLLESQHLVLDYGMDFHYNNLNSTAFEENLIDDSVNEFVFSRYPSGGSNMTLLGVYGELDWEKKDSSIILNAGIRYSSSRWNIKYSQKDPFNWPDDFYSGINSSNSAITWAMSSIFRLKPSWSLQALVSTAFRSPNIDDIGKIRVKGDEVSIPNPSLNPEKSINYELSLSKSLHSFLGKPNSKLGISLTGFYTDLSNAIVREFYALPDGSNFLVDEGDTLRTVANINAGEAYIYGVSTKLDWRVNSRWKWSGSINYLKGRVNEEGEDSPLSHIPPVYGKLSSNYSFKDWEFKALWSFNFIKKLQDYGGSEDNLDKATPSGTPGWNTINIYISKQILPTVKVNLGFENLLDQHYRPFASGVSAPGFNAIISVNGQF